jgi:hypothetical protein
VPARCVRGTGETDAGEKSRKVLSPVQLNTIIFPCAEFPVEVVIR